MPRLAEAVPAAPAVSITDVSFSYRRQGVVRPAVADLSLEIAPREFVAIIGANGTGKSTLLRLISGLLTPDRGSVGIDGEPVAGPNARVGFVFQEPRLLPWRTALDNVAFPLELAGWTRARREERAVELLHRVGLGDAGSLRPHEMSGGMRQRTSIARALAMEPSVLLLDEPFSALDALTRERFNLQLHALWRATRATVVLVTHSISEALLLADRAVVLAGHPGRVAAVVPIAHGLAREAAEREAVDEGSPVAVIRAALAGDRSLPPADEAEW